VKRKADPSSSSGATLDPAKRLHVLEEEVDQEVQRHAEHAAAALEEQVKDGISGVHLCDHLFVSGS
jgi:hypothetical protein